VAVLVKGRDGVLTVALRQQQEGLGTQAAHIPDIQTVSAAHHQRRAPAGHLLRHRQIQRAVAGHQALHLAAAFVAGAHQCEGRLFPGVAAVAAHVGVHGDGVGAVALPQGRRLRAHAQNDVQSLGVGGADQIGQHIRAHGAVAQVAGAVEHDGGQLLRRRIQQHGAVVAQRLRISHAAGAEHIGKVFQDFGAELVQLRTQAQCQRRFLFTDTLLQDGNGHGDVLLLCRKKYIKVYYNAARGDLARNTACFFAPDGRYCHCTEKE